MQHKNSSVHVFRSGGPGGNTEHSKTRDGTLRLRGDSRCFAPWCCAAGYRPVGKQKAERFRGRGCAMWCGEAQSVGSVRVIERGRSPPPRRLSRAEKRTPKVETKEQQSGQRHLGHGQATKANETQPRQRDPAGAARGCQASHARPHVTAACAPGGHSARAYLAERRRSHAFAGSWRALKSACLAFSSL